MLCSRDATQWCCFQYTGFNLITVGGLRRGNWRNWEKTQYYTKTASVNRDISNSFRLERMQVGCCKSTRCCKNCWRFLWSSTWETTGEILFLGLFTDGFASLLSARLHKQKVRMYRAVSSTILYRQQHLLDSMPLGALKAWGSIQMLSATVINTTL